MIQNNIIKEHWDYFMQQARNEAQQAFSKGEIPVGAVVVHNERIIARAHNMTETLTDVTAHAEMQAITIAANVLGGKYLTDCAMFVTLEPCSMCAAALGWAQLSLLVYGADDLKRGYRLFAPNVLHPSCRVESGVMEQECSALLKRFFATLR